MKESMRQLMGLERRKRGLGMLADAIERGIVKENDHGDDVNKEECVKDNKHDHGSNDKDNEENTAIEEKHEGNTSKRKREDNGDESERLAKKERVDTES